MIQYITYYVSLTFIFCLIGIHYFVGFDIRIIAILGGVVFIIPNFQFGVRLIKNGFRLLRKEKLLKLAWVMLFASALLWRLRVRGISDLSQNPIDATSFLRITEVAIACLIAIFLFRRDTIAHLFFGLLGFLLIYSIIGILSGLYSSMPIYTIYKAFETGTGVLLTAATLGKCHKFDDIRDFIHLNFAFWGLLLLLIWLGVVFAPDLALKPSKGIIGFNLFGVFPIVNANSVGFIAALIALCSFNIVMYSKDIGEKIFYQSILFLSFITLVVAQSRTSLLGFFVVMAIFFYLNKKRFYFLILVISLIVIILGGTIGSFVLEFLSRGESEEMLVTMTGRTTMWAHAWQMFNDAPMLGYGFASGARDALGSHGVGLHGSFFDVIVNVGLLGLIPWLLSVLGTWFLLLKVFVQYSQSMTPDVRIFHIQMIGVMTLITFRALTGTNIVMHDREFLLLLITLGYAHLSNKSRGFTGEERI